MAYILYIRFCLNLLNILICINVYISLTQQSINKILHKAESLNKYLNII